MAAAGSAVGATVAAELETGAMSKLAATGDPDIRADMHAKTGARTNAIGLLFIDFFGRRGRIGAQNTRGGIAAYYYDLLPKNVNFPYAASPVAGQERRCGGAR